MTKTSQIDILVSESRRLKGRVIGVHHNVKSREPHSIDLNLPGVRNRTSSLVRRRGRVISLWAREVTSRGQ